jgi:hypothetical protein
MRHSVIGDWYRWVWARWPRDEWAVTGRDIVAHSASRKGQRCKLLAVGAMNAAAIEFEDGARFITSRQGLRKLIDDG